MEIVGIAIIFHKTDLKIRVKITSPSFIRFSSRARRPLYDLSTYYIEGRFYSLEHHSNPLKDDEQTESIAPIRDVALSEDFTTMKA